MLPKRSQWEPLLTTLQFALLMATICLWGGAILARLPAKVDPKLTDFETMPVYGTIDVRVKSISKSEFEIKFWNGWKIGRNIELSSEVVSKWNYEFSDVDDWPIFEGKYFSIIIVPTFDHFSSSIIGEIEKPKKGPCSCVIRIPFQVSHLMIEDFNYEENQTLTIQYTRMVKENGQVWFPVVGIVFGDSFG